MLIILSTGGKTQIPLRKNEEVGFGNAGIP
jgi:hypothetical protein